MSGGRGRGWVCTGRYDLALLTVKPDTDFSCLMYVRHSTRACVYMYIYIGPTYRGLWEHEKFT